jgi:hypothetical protein
MRVVGSVHYLSRSHKIDVVLKSVYLGEILSHIVTSGELLQDMDVIKQFCILSVIIPIFDRHSIVRLKEI